MVTVENRWLFIGTRRKGKHKRLLESRDKKEGGNENEKGGGGREDGMKKRKNVPVSWFGLETLITQDHTL